jgi:broad specificity phosphatase PhoE
VGVILLVRHGEAADDESTDPGLSPRGREQVAALTDRLAREDATVVRHGPRRRARESAEIIGSGLHTECRATELLDDRTPVPSAANRGSYSERALEWLEGVPEAERDVDGMTLARAWQRLCADAGPDPVVLVTHAFVIAQFVCLAVDAGAASWMRLPVANASLTIIDTDATRDPRLRVFNEHVRAAAEDR